MDQTKKKKVFPLLMVALNGILFSITSLLNTYNENISQLEPTQALRLFILCVLGVTIVGLIVYVIWRSYLKASLITFIISVFFFLYGHIQYLLESNSFSEFSKHRILIPLFFVIAVIQIFLISRSKETSLKIVNRLITFLVGFLVFYNLIAIGIGLYMNSLVNEKSSAKLEVFPTLTAEQEMKLPDIYWIILDGYERKDALQKHFGFDNSSFLNNLEKRGFIVPPCSLSNYPLTAQTISTAMNMDYLENLSSSRLVDGDQLDYRVFRNLIANSKLVGILESYQYQTVAFKTEYSFTELYDSDYYIQPPRNSFIYEITHPVLTNFEEEFFSTTLMKLVFDMPSPMKKRFFEFIGNPSETKYDIMWFNFTKLKEIRDIEGRKFVFAHLLSTHQPFVMKPDGSYQFFEDPSEGYINSLIATNDEMLVIIDQIIEKSVVPPVIVIQGDHAFMDDDKTKVLNAYYLPGVDRNVISDDITPVNTFRLILSQYFGFSLPLLENRSFLTPDKHKPVDFIMANPSCY